MNSIPWIRLQIKIVRAKLAYTRARVVELGEKFKCLDSMLVEKEDKAVGARRDEVLCQLSKAKSRIARLFIDLSAFKFQLANARSALHGDRRSMLPVATCDRDVRNDVPR